MSHRLPLADIKFIEDFAAYARSRGDDEYSFSNFRNCACAQFLKATGRAKSPIVGAFHWLDDEARTHWFNNDRHTSWDGVAGAIKFGDHTFAALADRLDALLLDAPVVERMA